MLTTLLVAPLLGAFPQGPKFEPPVRMKAGEDYVRVEKPGYAFPCWADVDNDGKKDLVVGQFAGGKMKVFKNQGGANPQTTASNQQAHPLLAAGDWLKAEGANAEVPGVW